MLVGKAGHRKIAAVILGLASGLNYQADSLADWCRQDIDNEKLVSELCAGLDTLEGFIQQYRQEEKELYNELFGY